MHMKFIVSHSIIAIIVLIFKPICCIHEDLTKSGASCYGYKKLKKVQARNLRQLLMNIPVICTF